MQKRKRRHEKLVEKQGRAMKKQQIAKLTKNSKKGMQKANGRQKEGKQNANCLKDWG